MARKISVPNGSFNGVPDIPDTISSLPAWPYRMVGIESPRGASPTNGGGGGINRIAYGAGVWVAGGGQAAARQDGALSYSADGVTWTQAAAYGYVSSVIFANSLFVAVGGHRIMTSPDGIVWTPQDVPGTSSTVTLFGIRYVNSLFIAVGSNDAVLTSADGITWTPSGSLGLANNGTTDAAYGAGLYVVCNGFGGIATSPDAITWTVRTSSFSTTAIRTLLFANSLFIATGDSGKIATSADGITWTQRTANAGTDSLVQSVFANSLFVVAGAAGRIVTSPDGTTWTSRTSNMTGYVQRLIYANSIFVAVGDSGLCSTSSDGVTWTARTVSIFAANSARPIIDVTYDNSKFVAVGRTFTSSSIANTHASTSSDGITWTDTTSLRQGMQNLLTAAYGAGKYVAGGDDGMMVISTDLTTWIPTICGFEPQASTIRQIIFANSVFVAVGDNGKLSSSADGVTWTARTSQFGADHINGVLYEAGVFVAYGAAGKISTSTDGATWVAQTSQFSSSAVNKVIFANSIFVAVGAGGKISTSSDGATWVARTAAAFLTSGHDITGIAYGNGIFMAGSTRPQIIITSPDAITWTARVMPILPPSQGITSFTFGNGTWLAADASAIIAYSKDNGVTWSMITGLMNATASLKRCLFYNGRFLMCISNAIHISTDGVVWKRPAASLQSGTANGVNFIDIINGRLIACTGGSNSFAGVWFSSPLS